MQKGSHTKRQRGKGRTDDLSYCKRLVREKAVEVSVQTSPPTAVAHDDLQRSDVLQLQIASAAQDEGPGVAMVLQVAVTCLLWAIIDMVSAWRGFLGG